MAKTIADLVTRAMQRLYVKVGGEALSAEDMALGVDAWNGMVAGWFADGLTPYADETLETRVALVEGTVYTSGSAFPLLDRHFEGCAAMLAVSVSDDLQASVGAGLARDAMTGRQRIDAAFMPSMVADLDRALKRFPSSQYWPSE